ncbi:MAG: peroxiredoxin [Candidatus Reddybacter sp.]
MNSSKDLGQLRADLPRPEDDDACDHLLGMHLPNISLASTQGGEVNLSLLSGLTVIYIYPMSGRPGVPLPDGWDQIPGARGCTPQACALRDHSAELKQLNARVFGLSTQSGAYQLEAAERLHLPFALLSDASLAFARKLSLPTMDIEGQTLMKRITLVCDSREIVQVFYPVFPPDASAKQVINWLRRQ